MSCVSEATSYVHGPVIREVIRALRAGLHGVLFDLITMTSSTNSLEYVQFPHLSVVCTACVLFVGFFHNNRNIC